MNVEMFAREKERGKELRMKVRLSILNGSQRKKAKKTQKCGKKGEKEIAKPVNKNPTEASRKKLR